MSTRLHWIAAPAMAALSATSAFSATYLSVEQAQQAIFPGERLQRVDRTLTQEERQRVEARSGIRVRNPKLNLWRTAGGAWFLVDEVLGKHEFITMAIGIRADGKVQQIEVMDYRETYGFEVRNEAWRKQFQGKGAEDRFKLDEDIKNISGATLSCRHIADGVKRLLATYAICLKP